MEQKNLQKLFKESTSTPESRLSGDIWNTIHYKNNRMIKIKTFSYTGLSILSLFGSIFSIRSLVEQFIQLGFFDYLSLLFSDSGVIATYWKDYTLTLIDSLPVMSLIFSFFLLFVLFISIQKISYQFKNKLLASY